MTEREFHAVRRPSDAGPDVPTERACGECTLCCTLLKVDALRKLGGIPCTHLVSETGGCGIHSDRPRICRTYRCLWLQGGLEDEDRPDRLGAILELVSEVGTPYLAVREAVPGTHRTSARLREIIERFREATPVQVTHVADVMNPDAASWVFLPGQEGFECVEGDTRTTHREGQAPVALQLRWSERAARRLRARWQAWRVRDYGDGSGA